MTLTLFCCSENRRKVASATRPPLPERSRHDLPARARNPCRLHRRRPVADPHAGTGHDLLSRPDPDRRPRARHGRHVRRMPRARVAFDAGGLRIVGAARRVRPPHSPIIKIAGAFYLVWLGIQAIRHGSALTLKKGNGRKKSVSQVFLMGVGINLLNPKIVMFFLTFLPQFVSVSDPHAAEKLMFFGLYFIVLSIPICVRDDPDGRALHRRDAALAARDADFRLDVRRIDGNLRAAASVRARELKFRAPRADSSSARPCGRRTANRRSRR